jgi:hypothetical protein
MLASAIFAPPTLNRIFSDELVVISGNSFLLKSYLGCLLLLVRVSCSVAFVFDFNSDLDLAFQFDLG